MKNENIEFDLQNAHVEHLQGKDYLVVPTKQGVKHYFNSNMNEFVHDAIDRTLFPLSTATVVGPYEYIRKENLSRLSFCSKCGRWIDTEACYDGEICESCHFEEMSKSIFLF